MDCLPKDAPAPAVADADDTAVEVAALMARSRSPLVAVMDLLPHGPRPGGELLGVITASNLLHRLLGNA